MNNIHRIIIDLCQFLEGVKFLKRYAHPQGKAVGIWWNVHVAKPFTNVNTTPEIAHIVEKWQNWKKMFTGQCRNIETLSMALALYDMNPLVTSKFLSWRANRVLVITLSSAWTTASENYFHCAVFRGIYGLRINFMHKCFPYEIHCSFSFLITQKVVWWSLNRLFCEWINTTI